MGGLIFFVLMLSTKQTMLQGVSLKASVVILPYHKFIATIEPRQPELLLWSYEGKVVKKISFGDPLVNISETEDKLYVTLYSQEEEFYALALDSQLKASEKTAFKSIYSLAKIDGHWFAMDIIDIIEGVSKYPKLFRSLDGSEKSIFKVPQEMRDAKFLFKRAWVFPWEKGFIGLVMGSPMLYLLDPKYLDREKLESDSVETEKRNKVSLKIPGLDSETFTPKTLMSKEEYISSMKAWFSKKVLIKAVWMSRYGLTIACGDPESAVIFYLDPLLEVQSLQNVKGRIMNGHGNFFWIRQEVNGSIIIETRQLP